MIDFGKTYCNLHPQELITNFCNKEQCLVGLCANCICTHTQNHVEKGTSPDYENIRLTYKKAHQSIRAQVEMFQKDKQRIESVTRKVIEKRQKVREIINLAKEEVSVLLGDYFEQKQKNMIRQIESEEKKHGLHCEGRLDCLNSYIARQASNLISAAQQLSSNNFLQSLPRIRTQYLVNSMKLHLDVEEELTQNQKFGTTISCNKALLPGLIQILDRAIVTYTNANPGNQNSRKQSGYLNRPRSQGKGTHNVFYHDLGSNSFQSTNLQRNAQSQLNFYPPTPQIQSIQPRLQPQVYKSSFLSQIPQIRNDTKNTFDNGQKVSTSGNIGNNFIENSNKNLPHPGSFNIQIYNPPTQVNPPNTSINFQTQPTNNPKPMNPKPLQNTWGSNRQPHHQIFSKSTQKPYNPISSQPIYNPNMNSNIHIGRQLEKSTASVLNKKSKKSGLKLSNLNEFESEFNQNTQNQKPKQGAGYAPYF